MFIFWIFSSLSIMQFDGSLDDVWQYGLKGLVPTSHIAWTAKSLVQGEGWKICRAPPDDDDSVPWWGTLWTCTKGGNPCLNGSVCTTQFFLTLSTRMVTTTDTTDIRGLRFRRKLPTKAVRANVLLAGTKINTNFPSQVSRSRASSLALCARSQFSSQEGRNLSESCSGSISEPNRLKPLPQGTRWKRRELVGHDGVVGADDGSS